MVEGMVTAAALPACLREAVESVRPVDAEWVRRAEERQATLTKPPGSLGRLEDIAARLCAIQETLRPAASPRRIVVFAADHGVAARGVSAYPAEVTPQMVANFVRGGAAINALARAAMADVQVIDVGVASPVAAQGSAARFVSRRIRAGTRDLAVEAAMSEEEMLAAIGVGLDVAEEAERDGIVLLGMGEMGIGNTTAASALTAALIGLAPSQVTGRGTGVDEARLAHKIAVIAAAVEHHRREGHDAFYLARALGGLEIAALAGLCLGAARRRRVLVADGFIATAGVLVAATLCPAVTGYVVAAHLSPERGHQVQLDALGLRPLLDLQMRLGEGTGAALAMNVIGAAVAAFNEMATFAGAGVSGRQ